MARSTCSLIRFAAAVLALLQLAGGVLGVRDTDHPLAALVRPKVNNGESVDVIYSNGGLTSKGGHPAQILDPHVAGEHGAVSLPRKGNMNDHEVWIAGRGHWRRP